ncbi:penicillin-binding protein activator [Roseospirillum parvum]|uniref:ABC-type branched-chain amino acid transport system, substrate-binding protein n=1 Tax=Roseospirillum parvum TaxID=83401 RepID=A0A1G7Z9G1_9PROT|nr:penicillin-binding protein activator [Roseospirillum parvum]SDH05237.1 ABC-type branched-chain amino acid transport system, substrate-binding protein [Roseospirillum parvum]
MPEPRHATPKPLRRVLIGALMLGLAGCQTIQQVAPEAPPAEEPPPPVAAAPAPAVVAPEPEPAPLPPPEPQPELPWQTGVVPPDRQDGLVRVGLLLPLSGRAAPVGQAILNAAQMALFDVAQPAFVLQPYDTAGTPQGAAAASHQALEEGAQLLLGPLFAQSVTAASPPAQAAGVEMVAFSSVPGVAAPGVHLMGFLMKDQVRRVMEEAYAQQHDTVAVLAPAGAEGDLVVDAARRVAADHRRPLGRIARFDPATEDMAGVVKSLADYASRQGALQAQVSALKARGDAVGTAAAARLAEMDTLGAPNFDALLVVASGDRLIEIAALLPYYDVDPAAVKLLGTMRWAEESNLGREPGMVGAWFPAPAAGPKDAFTERYRRAFGSAPPTIASLGYDATALAAVLARQGGAAAFSARALTQPTGFAGVNGIFRLTPDGLNERGLAVMAVTPQGRELVSPAPTSFPEPAGIGTVPQG